MSIITDILEFLGLIETAPDDASVAPCVMVKIVDAIALNLEQGDTLTLDQLAAKAGAAGTGTPVDTIRAILPDIAFARAFDSLSPEDIQALVTAASAEDPTYVPYGFNNALQVVCDIGYDTSELEAALNNWTVVVEYAYTGADASDPNVVATGNPLFKVQKYLNSAPDGIGAQSAWAKGADGSGTNFIDLEQGWFLPGIGPPGKVLSGHADLPPSGITLLAGTNRAPQKGEHFLFTSLGHGASVLGMIVGLDDNFGIVGAAPKTTTRVISYFDPKDKTKGNSVKQVADRIGVAASTLSAGDVLQIEAQFEGKIGKNKTLLPVEFEDMVWQAIKVATTKGIIVIEAAGNGGGFPNAATKKMEHRGTDLDTFVPDPKKKEHALSRSAANDSGAIMVTGSTSTVPHSPHKKLNFGSRIDCYGWGDDIVTCFWDPQFPNDRDLYMGIQLYWDKPFGGTSGACPMITASCLLMQHLQTLLTPKGRPAGKIKGVDMRTILSKPANGTASAAATDKIGVMPDFAKILTNEFMP